MSFNFGILVAGVIVAYLFKDYRKLHETTFYMRLIFALDTLNRFFLMDMLSVKKLPAIFGNNYSAVIPVNVLAFIIIFVGFTFYNSLNAVVQSDYTRRLERYMEFRYLGYLLLIIMLSVYNKWAA